MTGIRICAIKQHRIGGPDIPVECHARIAEIKHGPFKGVNILLVNIGDVDLRIWPADKHNIKKFGERLLKIAEEL